MAQKFWLWTDEHDSLCISAFQWPLGAEYTGPLNLEELELKVQNNERFSQCSKLVFVGYFCQRATHAELLGLGKAMASHKIITHLTLRGLMGINDHRFAIVLGKLGKTVSSLTLADVGGYLPETLREIEALPHLQHVTLKSWYDTYDDRCIKAVADSLERITNLRELVIERWSFRSPQRSWEPLIEVIQSNPNLERVEVSRRNVDSGPPFDLEPFSNALQTGPVIIRIKKLYNLNDDDDNTIAGGSQQRWVEAMISAREHSFECFHYFFAQLPPALWEDRTEDFGNLGRLFVVNT